MPIISEACWFYGWTYEDVMQMNCKAFFKMVEEGRKIRVGERIDDVTIASISIQDVEYQKSVIEDFKARMPIDPEEIERIREAAEAAIVTGSGAQNSLVAMFKR